MEKIRVCTCFSGYDSHKMAGNASVVDCLFYIFRNLFIGTPEEEKDTLF